MAENEATPTTDPTTEAPKTPTWIEGARTRSVLPAELPNALEAQKSGRPAGAAFQTANGDVYRLVHAGWRKDTRSNANNAPAPATAPATAPDASAPATAPEAPSAAPQATTRHRS